MKKWISPGKYKGLVQIPSSKSDSQRAILAAALANGNSKLMHVGASKDEQAMLTAVQGLGAKIIEKQNNFLILEGISDFPLQAHVTLGESGLGTRLMTSVLASNQGVFTLTGEGSLLLRPMDFFTEFLPKFGAQVTSLEGKLPLTIQGPMQGATVEIDGSLSSQFLSGLLMALPRVEGTSLLKVTDLKSIPYIQMTLHTLAQFGIQISQTDFSEFTISGGQNYTACTYEIEGDWSSASCWLVASALGQKIHVSGLNRHSLQADILILKAFEKANCQVEIGADYIAIHGENRIPFEFDANHCPDLFPALVCLAAFTPGISKIKGLGRLKHKESDRGLALQLEYKKLGIEISFVHDEMWIYGKKQVEVKGVFSAHNDHRIAMSLAVSGMFSNREMEISQAESVAKSYPGFWETFSRLRN